MILFLVSNSKLKYANSLFDDYSTAWVDLDFKKEQAIKHSRNLNFVKSYRSMGLGLLNLKSQLRQAIRHSFCMQLGTREDR